jgi:hypothetical protein
VVIIRLFVLVTALAAGSLPAYSQLPPFYTCSQDGNISAPQRKAIESTATEFLQKLLGPGPEYARKMMSKAGGENVTGEQLKSLADMISQQMKPQNISLQHTYFIKLMGKSPGRAVCARDLTKPDGWESLQTADVSEQAHVLISGDTINNHLAFTVWLVREQNSWAIQSFSVNVATLADKDAMKLWQFAQEQHKLGHNFNASLYYAAATQVADRGPYFQMGIVQTISEDASTLTLPTEIKGPPPFLWKSTEKTYKVLQVGPMAIGGKIYLLLHHEVSPWQSNEQVDAWNRDFIRYIKQRFPEYSDAFAGIVIRALERGTTRGFGTVDELQSSKELGLP